MSQLAPRRRSALMFVLAATLVVAISTLAYTNHVPRVFSSHGIDKVLHAGMTLTLTLLLARALRGRAVLAAVLVITPVAIDEYMQRFSAARTSDWRDLIADLLGAALAVAIVRGDALVTQK